jgi:DNA-binding CsgD family transcriptional regulator
MAIHHLEIAGVPTRHGKLAGPPRRSIRNREGELTEMRLRDALAREESLRHQIDELTHHQHDVSSKLLARRKDAADRMASLTPRQRQVMELVLAGHSSKNIAAELGLSRRTVENHRAQIKARTGAKSLPELARLALAAAWNGDPAELRDCTQSRRKYGQDACGRIVDIQRGRKPVKTAPRATSNETSFAL